MLGDCVLRSVRHHGSQRVQAAHPVVVTFLVHRVVVVYHWNVLLKNPVLREVLGQNGRLLNTHSPHACSGIRQISHECSLEMLLEKIFSKDDSKISNKLKDSHSNSPLTILGHVAESGHQLGGQEISADDVGDLDKSADNVELHFGVVVLEELHQDWKHLLGSVLLTNDLSHFAEGLGGTCLELGGGISVGVL